MALRFSLTVNAERDLLNIEDFIASEDETAAIKVVHRLEHAIATDRTTVHGT
jgi:plasmid stabilization system protein ParE